MINASFAKITLFVELFHTFSKIHGLAIILYFKTVDFIIIHQSAEKEIEYFLRKYTIFAFQALFTVESNVKTTGKAI